MVEGACLENRCTFARTGGSNPFLTANNLVNQLVTRVRPPKGPKNLFSDLSLLRINIIKLTLIA